MANCWDLSPDGWNFSTPFSTSRFLSWYPSHTTDHLFLEWGGSQSEGKRGNHQRADVAWILNSFFTPVGFTYVGPNWRLYRHDKPPLFGLSGVSSGIGL